MTYVALYSFRLRAPNVQRFLEIQLEAAEIQRRHGALSDATYASVDTGAKYGLSTLGEALGAERDDVVFVEVAAFRERAHHDEVMARVDTDERIAELYREVTALIDLSRCARAELEPAGP